MEIVGALAIGSSRSRTEAARATVPLILLLLLLNLGYANRDAAGGRSSKVVTWVLVSAYLGRPRWSMRDAPAPTRRRGLIGDARCLAAGLVASLVAIRGLFPFIR